PRVNDDACLVRGQKVHVELEKKMSLVADARIDRAGAGGRSTAAGAAGAAIAATRARPRASLPSSAGVARRGRSGVTASQEQEAERRSERKYPFTHEDLQ